MGIPFFFKRFKYLFPETLIEYENDHDILVIELNGIFYQASKVLYYKRAIMNSDNSFENIEYFEYIGDSIFSMIEKYMPKKKIFLVTDGFAPNMKLKEQLQRRYKNSIHNIYEGFFDLLVGWR